MIDKFYNKCYAIAAATLVILGITNPVESTAWIIISCMFLLLAGFDFLEEVGL